MYPSASGHSLLDHAVRRVRATGAGRLRADLIGDEGLGAHEFASPEDPGWFGPGSSVWRVHADSSTLIGGLSALLLQTLHPLAMAGVADHSDYADDPLGRLNRTGRFVGATTFGSTATADGAVAMVRAIHDRVTGTAPDGRLYAANDPHLLGWVHCTEVDSFLRAYERYGAGRLREHEKDAYVAEMARVGEALGAEDLPRDRAALAHRLSDYGLECRFDAQAAGALPFLLDGPWTGPVAVGYQLIAAAAIDLLPRWAREMADLRPAGPLDPTLVRPAAWTLARGLGWFLSAPDGDRLSPV